MNRTIRIMTIFVLPWWAYYAGHGILLGFPPLAYFLPNLLVPTLFLALSGFVFSAAAARADGRTARSPGARTFRNLIPVLLLVAVDQGIKAFLFTLEWETIHIGILPGFAVAPVLNSYGSYLASILKTNVPSAAYYVLYAVAGILYFEGFRYYLQSGRRSFWATGAMVLFFGGLISVFLDNLIHKGSLDYLLIEPLFTCDLKDFYLTFGVIFIFTETAERSAAVKRGELQDDFDFRFRDLLKFIAGDVRSLLRRKQRRTEKNVSEREES